MRVIAQSDHWYLLQVSEDTGRVFDMQRGRLFGVMSLAAIAARGGWEQFRGDEGPILAALASAHDLSPDHAEQEPLRPAVSA